MRVKVLKRFFDKKEQVVREVGDEFITNKNRFAEIVKTLKKYDDTNWIEEVKED